MTRAKDIALLVLLIAASGALVFTAWDLHQTQVAVRLRLPDLQQTNVDLDGVLKRVNSPTGPITEVDKLLLALKSTTVHADMVIAHEDKQLARYDEYVAGISGDVHGLAGRLGGAVDALKNTADAGTGSAQALTKSLGTLDITIAAARPVLGQLALTAAASTQTMNALDSRLRDPKIDELMEHIRGMSASGDKMLVDAQYKTHQLLHPDKRKLTFIGGVDATVLWIHSHLVPPIF